MGEDQVTITLPITEHGLGVVITILGVAALSVVVFWMTGKGEPKDWFTTIREKMGLTGLHPLLVIFLSLALAALFLTLLTGIFWVLFAIGDKVSAESEAEGLDLRWYLLTLTAVTAALGAVISLPFTLIKTTLNRRQTETSEQGHITDRINKAVEGLGAEKIVKSHWKDSRGKFLFHEKEGSEGSGLTELDYKRPVITELTEPNLEVRIGAIYALERISQDSARDHIQIMEILCAYIRQNAGREDVPLPEGDPTPEGWKAWAQEGRDHPRLDVDVALKVIERRSEARKQLERDKGYRLGLERAQLRKIVLSQRDLTGADLQNAELQGADLGGAKLQGADFGGAGLQGADLRGGELQGTNLRGAELHGAKLTGASLRGAVLSSVDLTIVSQLTEHLQDMFGDASVTLPGGHGPEHESWPSHWPKFILLQEVETEWRKWQANPDNYTPPRSARR